MKETSITTPKLVKIYLFVTLAIYLIPFAFFFSYLFPIGFHSPYYLFALFMVLSDIPYFPGWTIALALGAASGILLILLFIIFLLMALIKKKYTPFGVVVAISNFVTISAV